MNLKANLQQLTTKTLCLHVPYAVTESVQRRLPMRNIRSSNTSRIKPMTFKIKTFHYLAWRLILIGQENDFLAQCQCVSKI